MQIAAKAGNAAAILSLEAPEFPDALAYLWDWHRELRMGVREMMTWTDLVAWCQQMHAEPKPREVEALFYLDVIYRHPPKD